MSCISYFHCIGVNNSHYLNKRILHLNAMLLGTRVTIQYMQLPTSSWRVQHTSHFIVFLHTALNKKCLLGCAFCLFTPPHKPISYKVPDTPSFVLLILLKSVFMRFYLEAKGELATGWNMNCPLSSGPPSSQNWTKNSLLAPERSFLTGKSDQTNCSTAVTGAPSSRSSSSPPTSTS